MRQQPKHHAPTAAQGPSDQRRGAFVGDGTFHGPFIGNQENHEHHHYPAPPPLPLDLDAARTRTLMLQQVRRIWIDGMLNRSLYSEVQFQQGLRSDPNKVDLPVRLLVQETGDEAEDLSEGTRIADVSDRFGGALLILGAPGAGKTTLLLELARELLDRAEADSTLPIPVVFPLSTWASERKPLHAWLIDQLRVLYQVSKQQAMAWVEQHQILPLLDGLDEVTEAHRPACVRAINAFREERGVLPLVVCSRLHEYETVAQEAAQLRLHGAVIVQTLRQAVVLEVLAGLGPEVQALRDTLAADERDWLWKVATSPLGLSVLIPAVQHNPALLQAGGSDDARRDRIFGAYVDAMFARRAALGRWSREQTIRRLSWLAAQMQAREQTLFLLEGLQPHWLPQRWQKQTATWGLVLFLGLVFGQFLGLFFGLFFGQVFGQFLGMIGGLFFGLVFGGFFGQVGDLDNKIITPVEHISWSWAAVWKSVASSWYFSLFAGLVFGRTSELNIGLFLGLVFGLVNGLVVAPVITFTNLLPGLKIQAIGVSQQPNQGMISTARNALIIFLLFGLVFGLVGGLSFGLIFGLIGGLNFSAFYGGIAVIRYCTLRLLLTLSGLAPLRYAAFLDHAADRVLLRRVGGGWVFVHRELLDYFAGLAPGLGVPLPEPAKEESPAKSKATS